MRPSSYDHLSRNGSAWAGKSGVRRRTTQRHPASEPVTLTRIPGRCPKFEHHDALHEPTLIAAARSQMTASSPRGTFSQAELTAELPVRNLSPAPNERDRAGQTGTLPMRRRSGSGRRPRPARRLVTSGDSSVVVLNAISADRYADGRVSLNSRRRTDQELWGAQRRAVMTWRA